MRISDWSSDVCSSDLAAGISEALDEDCPGLRRDRRGEGGDVVRIDEGGMPVEARSEEHTSELQSLMRISYAVFCLKKKTQATEIHRHSPRHSAQNNTRDE